VKVRQSTVKDCLRSMQYTIEQPTFHGGSVRALGTGYHAGVELLYLARQHGLVLPTPAEAIAHAIKTFDDTSAMVPSHATELTRTAGNFKWNKTVPDRETAVEMLNVMLPAYYEQGLYPADWKVLGVEVPFELAWSELGTRNGSIDLVLQDPNGWVVIDDQKTAGKAWPEGKHKPRKAHQAPWYVSAARELFPGAPGYRFVFSIMTYKGKFERRISDPEPRHEAAADQLLFDTVALYKTARANGLELPANPSSNLCSPEYCDWWDICPFGAALDT
jgi:hypothetical protein